MFRWFHQLGSPPHFYRIAGRWIPWLGGIFTLLLLSGLYSGLWLAPSDYQQGDSYRIIYVHVPAAWMSLFVYVVMAFCGVVIVVWRMKLAGIVLISSAPVGAVNIPIIHYSMEWWHSLHQGPTVTKFDKPSIHWSMLIPLLLMALAFKCYYLMTLLQRCRNQLLQRECHSKWVEELN